MKKIVLFIFTIFLINSAYGQRQAGGWAIQGKFGLMEGRGQMNTFWGAFPEGQAVSTSIGVNTLIGNKGTMFEANLFMNDYFVDKDNFNLPYRLYGLSALGGWSYEKVRKFYFNLKGGTFAGIERVNGGNDKEANTGATFANSVSNFVYGVLVMPEVEYSVYNKITLTVSYTQYWKPSSKWSRFSYGLELGVKYYL